MIRQKELLSHLCWEGRMLRDSSWGSVSTPTRLGNEEHSGLPLGFALCQRVFDSLPNDISFEAIYFPSAMTTADVIGALESFPHGGSISMVNLSLLPEQSTHLASRTLPLGLDSLWGLAVLFRTELRPQGSQPGKLLEQTMYMQYPQAFLKQYRAKNKSQLP